MEKLGLLLEILLLQCSQLVGEKVGCGSKYDTANWDCDDFQHYFSQSNLEKTLYCIGYNKMVSPKRALNLSNKTEIQVKRLIRSFDKVHEFDQVVSFEEKVLTIYYHKQLEFVNDCDYLSMSFEYEADVLFTFVPKTFLGDGFRYQDFSLGLHLV